MGNWFLYYFLQMPTYNPSITSTSSIRPAVDIQVSAVLLLRHLVYTDCPARLATGGWLTLTRLASHPVKLPALRLGAQPRFASPLRHPLRPIIPSIKKKRPPP